MAWFEFWVLAHIFFILYSVWKNAKKLFKSSSHFGSRKSTPKMGVGAVVIAKMNEAKRWCPFWGSGNDSQNGSRILCVLWKAWLGISMPEMKICNRKPLNSDLKTLLAKRVLFHAIQNTEMAFCCGDPRQSIVFVKWPNSCRRSFLLGE